MIFDESVVCHSLPKFVNITHKKYLMFKNDEKQNKI